MGERPVNSAAAFDQTTIFGDVVPAFVPEPATMTEYVHDLVLALRLVERQTPILLALDGLTDQERQYVLYLARRVAATLATAAGRGRER